MTLFSSSILKILHSAKLLFYCKYLENNLWIHFQFPPKKQKRGGIIINTFAFKDDFLSFSFWTYGKMHCIQFIDLGIFTEKIIELAPILSFKHFSQQRDGSNGRWLQWLKHYLKVSGRILELYRTKIELSKVEGRIRILLINIPNSHSIN